MGTGVIRKKLKDEEVFNILKRGPLDTNQIANRLGRTNRNVNVIMQRLYKEGKVSRDYSTDNCVDYRVALWSNKK
jgi:predicted transcriptional regulator